MCIDCSGKGLNEKPAASRRRFGGMGGRAEGTPELLHASVTDDGSAYGYRQTLRHDPAEAAEKFAREKGSHHDLTMFACLVQSSPWSRYRVHLPLRGHRPNIPPISCAAKGLAR